MAPVAVFAKRFTVVRGEEDGGVVFAGFDKLYAVLEGEGIVSFEKIRPKAKK